MQKQEPKQAKNQPTVSDFFQIQPRRMITTDHKPRLERPSVVHIHRNKPTYSHWHAGPATPQSARDDASQANRRATRGPPQPLTTIDPHGLPKLAQLAKKRRKKGKKKKNEQIQIQIHHHPPFPRREREAMTRCAVVAAVAAVLLIAGAAAAGGGEEEEAPSTCARRGPGFVDALASRCPCIRIEPSPPVEVGVPQSPPPLRQIACQFNYPMLF